MERWLTNFVSGSAFLSRNILSFWVMMMVPVVVLVILKQFNVVGEGVTFILVYI